MTRQEREQATTEAGWRERYAMKHGKPATKYENGEKLIIFTYSAREEYQDANGATYSATRRAWVG